MSFVSRIRDGVSPFVKAALPTEWNFDAAAATAKKYASTTRMRNIAGAALVAGASASAYLFRKGIKLHPAALAFAGVSALAVSALGIRFHQVGKQYSAHVQSKADDNKKMAHAEFKAVVASEDLKKDSKKFAAALADVGHVLGGQVALRKDTTIGFWMHPKAEKVADVAKAFITTAAESNVILALGWKKGQLAEEIGVLAHFIASYLNRSVEARTFEAINALINRLGYKGKIVLETVLKGDQVSMTVRIAKELRDHFLDKRGYAKLFDGSVIAVTVKEDKDHILIKLKPTKDQGIYSKIFGSK